jgi:competence ComEA-like helix-hairpin-helix protein
MATQGERRALFFLAAVALLGAGTRAWRGRSVAVETTGLSRQIQAVDSAGPRARRSKGRKTATRNPQPATRNPPRATRIDLDTASAAEIEKLPGIGPALAKRIVKDRETNGPFGCLAALDRVKGIGPALLSRIDSVATFSAAGGAPCASGGRHPEVLPLQ